MREGGRYSNGKTTSVTDTAEITLGNRYSTMQEEMLDDLPEEARQGKVDDNSISMSDLDDVWETAGKPKAQRKTTQKRTTKDQPKETKGAISKRSRETSPKAEANPKDRNKRESPPTKRNLGLAYSSSSEGTEGAEGDEKMELEENKKSSEEVFQIPTIVSSKATEKQFKERIPNPFRREEVQKWDDHPLMFR